jgi:aryl-alcohol dehydrogenase-like predicted oxidoreductase
VELRRLGTSGLRVNALSLGAMIFGAETQTLMKGVTSSDEEARRVFDRAVEAGINLVDTANVYTEGRSEELTGEWVAGKRDQMLIATKCRFPIGYGITHKPRPHEWGLSRKAIITACEGSLRRLKTDVIDLYQVHMEDRNVVIDETLRALDDLVTEGKVRYIGCSNYAGYSLVESLWAADRLLTHRYESIQLQWSLVQRSAERELTHPQTSSIIVGVRTEAELEDNLRALAVKLTSEDLKELDEASRPNWDYPWDAIRDAEAGDAKLLA